MKKVISWLDSNLEETLLLILLGILSCTMMLQIIMRFVFNHALPWAEEVARYCFVYSGFISIPYTVKRGIGIKVDVLYKLFPEFLKKVLNYFYEILQLLFYGYLCYASFAVIKVAMSNGAVSSALCIPLVYIYMILPIGFGVAALRLVQKLIYLLKNNGVAQQRITQNILEDMKEGGDK